MQEKQLTLIESLNCSPPLHYYSLFHANESIFEYIEKNGKEWKTNDIINILEDCGYSILNEKKHTKSGNLILVNLISPKVDYNSHDKSNINLEQFASIAQDLYKTCKSNSRSGGRNNTRVKIRYALKRLLKQRLLTVKKNQMLINETNRWTQSTVFYRLRPILIDNGYTEIEKKRKYITGLIKGVCEEIGEEDRGQGYKRHELGIIAAERAQLYSDGKSFGVSYDRLKDLVKKGTDLIVIEKEGIADVLMDFANKRGIAILNSRGFLTEYASELSELAEQEGCHIAILTDLDSSGLLISSNLPNAYRVGIDFDTLRRFGLEKEEVEEKVLKDKESDNHLTSLIEKIENEEDPSIPKPYKLLDWVEMIKYLEDRNRIEIDSVLAAVEDSRIFWDYILEELDAVFKSRDYNRAIDIPNHVKPDLIAKLFTNIENRLIESQSEEIQKIKNEIKDTSGFYYIESKTQELENRIRFVCNNNDVKKIITEEFKKFSSQE